MKFVVQQLNVPFLNLRNPPLFITNKVLEGLQALSPPSNVTPVVVHIDRFKEAAVALLLLVQVRFSVIGTLLEFQAKN